MRTRLRGFRVWVTMLAACMLVLVTAPTHARWAELPRVETIQTSLAGGMLQEKRISFPNGDRYWIKRLTAHTDGGPYTFQLELKGETGVFRYPVYRGTPHLDHAEWRQVPLQDGVLPVATGFLETDQMHVWISMPNVFRPLGKGTIEEVTEWVQPIRVHKVAGGYRLDVRLPQKAGLFSEIWALESAHPLVPWEHGSMKDIWLRLDLNRVQKWSYDGFYVRSPATYRPYSDRSFWRNPSNYVLRSFLLTGGSRAAEDMGYVMLETALANQEPEGYWKTLPLSAWLWQLYRIGDGFYDTRFNTDLAYYYLKGYHMYQDPRFLAAAQKYAGYFIRHASARHIRIDGEREGWLVADYAHPGNHAMTHVSLNHQLQEINYLYELYRSVGTPVYKDLADKLVAGVVNVGDRWMKPDGNLHYAYLPNGKLDMNDYPYLTYNDLKETQRLLRALYGEEHPVLANLMASKKGWMERNGVVNPFERK